VVRGERIVEAEVDHDRTVEVESRALAADLVQSRGREASPDHPEKAPKASPVHDHRGRVRRLTIRKCRVADHLVIAHDQGRVVWSVNEASHDRVRPETAADRVLAQSLMDEQTITARDHVQLGLRLRTKDGLDQGLLHQRMASMMIKQHSLKLHCFEDEIGSSVCMVFRSMNLLTV